MPAMITKPIVILTMRRATSVPLPARAAEHSIVDEEGPSFQVGPNAPAFSIQLGRIER
jgi:hypothetical protein